MTDAEFRDAVLREAERLAKDKETLRLALNEKGFAIPAGLTIGEWAKRIRGDQS